MRRRQPRWAGRAGCPGPRLRSRSWRPAPARRPSPSCVVERPSRYPLLSPQEARLHGDHSTPPRLPRGGIRPIGHPPPSARRARRPTRRGRPPGRPRGRHPRPDAHRSWRPQEQFPGDRVDQALVDGSRQHLLDGRQEHGVAACRSLASASPWVAPDGSGVASGPGADDVQAARATSNDPTTIHRTATSLSDPATLRRHAPRNPNPTAPDRYARRSRTLSTSESP
jgi:hypothetical protein